jgi:hypothetical protein
VQPILAAEGADDLVALGEAEAKIGWGDWEDIAWCRSQRRRPREELDPPPLLAGDDLKRHGLPPGPLYSTVLDSVRRAQLDGVVSNREQALQLVDRLLIEQRETLMDKKAKKKTQAINQRIQKLRQQLAGAKQQADDPSELAAIQKQLADAEAELAKLKRDG